MILYFDAVVQPANFSEIRCDIPELKEVISFVCYESNMVYVNINTCWIDSGSTIHISNSLQGFQNLRKPVGSEQSILSRNKMSSNVEAIVTFYLTLSSGFVLELEKTFYVPSFSRNLISVSRLVPFGYSLKFSEKKKKKIFQSIL